jgi:ATP-dependent Clp protease ATP-binding subunit ClpA
MNWFKSFWAALTMPMASTAPKEREVLEGLEPPADLSPRAQKVLELARREADRFNHNFVGTEHLLLGLIYLGQGTAVKVLGKLGIDLEAVRMEIEKWVGPGPAQKVIGNIPYTPRVKKVLAFVSEEARALNHTYVGTEHILLGLLREGEGVAGRVLKQFGVELEKTREEILRELEPIPQPQHAAPMELPETSKSASLPSHREGGEFLESGYNFTPRAMQVLALARREAHRLNHNFVGTEHLLLGLISLGQGVAVNILGQSGIDLETARKEVEKQVGTGPDQEIMGNIPYTPRVKKVLAFAAKDARTLNHSYVGTEHILLGILRDSHGVASRVLESLGVDPEPTRQQILQELDPNFQAKAGAEVAPQPMKLPAPKLEALDTNKRYDVYCSEGDQVVVYHNALFKGARELFGRGQPDVSAEFLELEQANGQKIFVARFSIIKLGEAGSAPAADD